MREEDKASSLIPQSPAQQLIKKVDRRDKLMRGVEAFVLLALVVFNIFTVARLQMIINNNQRDVLIARQNNIDRQQELKDYIKCIALIRYDTPSPPITRESTSAALDKCANGK